MFPAIHQPFWGFPIDGNPHINDVPVQTSVASPRAPFAHGRKPRQSVPAARRPSPFPASSAECGHLKTMVFLHFFLVPSGKHTKSELENHHVKIGKSTISMDHFNNSFLNVYQRVYPALTHDLSPSWSESVARLRHYDIATCFVECQWMMQF